MSQTFTGAADWSDYLHSTPSSIPSSTASIFPADVVISPDPNPNPTNYTFNSAPSGSNNPINNRTNRVTKPARKRSRASRRTPTTLLSTNTSNFRAMVQQFTGGPSALGFGIGTAAIDHPQPRRIADGLNLISSSPFANPWSGYSFQVNHHAPPTEQVAYGGGELIATSAAASGPNAKSDGGGGGGDRFLY